MKKWLTQIELKGNLVKLEPLTLKHAKALSEAAKDGKLWNLWYTSVPKPKNIDSYINKAKNDFNYDLSLPFAVILNETNQVIGSTRYMHADPINKRLEIGCTWYAKSVHKTGVNTECKYLLLKYAFEKLNCIAVEFRTHWHNMDSRKAIERLGAKQDGILRNHKVGKSGHYRDTVVFSIINSEWGTVKKSLEFKMNKDY